jgi:hypothetical protein
MRTRFPIGYFVLPALVAAVVMLAYAGADSFTAGLASPLAFADGPTAAADEGQATPGTSPDGRVDPRFLADDATTSPQERLERAAREIKPLDPGGAAAYEEYLDAMTAHPFVGEIFLARYARKIPAAGHKAGLEEFRRHYRIAVVSTTPRDYLPMTGCALSMSQVAAMESMLINSPESRRRIDRAVEAAARRR